MPPIKESSDAEPAFAFTVREVALRGGAVVELPAAGVTAIVGANNCGKSTFLNQVAFYAANPQGSAGWPFQLVEHVITERSGTTSTLREWLDSHRPVHQPDAGPKAWIGRTGVVHEYELERWPAAGTLDQNFVLQVNFEGHTGVDVRGGALEPPTHPLHVLEDHPARMSALNRAMEEIFGEKLTLDNTGRMRLLRLGTTDVSVPTLLGEKAEYVQALSALPLVSDQGDGMQRVVNILLTLLTSAYPVLIFDEPEAYLHPPQAKAIGQFIGRTVRELETQVVLATHDRNILAGLMASEVDLAVIRLNRNGPGTSAHVLSVDALRSVWSDPVLRYSNVLDGLFYRMVVLAEAEQDCRFYQAALEALDDTSVGSWPRPSDVLFVPSNGKANLFKLAEALQAVAVLTVASPDLDILNDETTLRRLVEALGGGWAGLAEDYATATASFRRPREPVSVAHVRTAIDRHLAAVVAENPTRSWDNDVKDEVRGLTRAGVSPWRALREYGERAFQGHEAATASRLLAALDARRVVTVRVGDLERFGRDLGVAKGREWLPAALRANAHRSDEALAHVRRLMTAWV
jgi:ABC-type enterochelin transport system ATPase subunit